MRLVSGLAAVVLAAAFAPLIVATSASAGPDVAPSFLVTLTDQHSHDASLAVRALYRPLIDQVVAQRDAIVETPADLQNPVVLELNARVDALMGEMRVRIAAEATRLHAYARSVVEPFIESLGGTVTYRSPLLNLDVVRLPEDRVEALRAHPLVASVEPDLALDIALDISVPAVGAPTFWANGFQGGPFKLVVPDTGIDASHPALLGKISDAQTFHDQARLQGDYADDWTTTDDKHGHGTHIAGIVASQDAVYRGVAYGMLGVINVKFGYLTNTGNGRGIESDSMKGMDWAILTVGGDVLSLSFGGGSNDNGESGWGRYMDALVDDLGIPVSVAAGNSGPGAGTLGIPATSYNIITVGALDDMNTVTRLDDAIASFSSRGPTGDGRLKPDIAAPGSDIVSTNAFWETQNDFVGFWGTSMAAPHVGAGLLLQENANGAPGFPARSKAVLLQTATDMGTGGPDNTYGWGSMNLAEAWTYRNAVVEGNGAVGAPVFFRIPGAAGDRATMVWQKHVVYNGINFPNTFFPLNNLDLNLYDETTGTRLSASARTRDNVEQVSFTGATTGIAKAFVVGTMNGVTQEPFALAAKVAPVAVAPPSMSVVVCCTRQVDSGASFQVTANVTNPGGLRLFTSTVTLNLPPGVTIVAGANPTSLGAIPAGTTRQATWTLTSVAVGTHTVSASATGAAFEESYSANGNPIQITVLDVTPPTILNHGGAPSPQNVGGFVNVSAAIADNVGVTNAWLEVTDPLGTFLGNFSMSYDPITARFYHRSIYSTLGRYDYGIAARDAAANWGFAAGAFLIADLEAPRLSAVTATPDPQEVHFSVNVTATATDNVAIWVSYLEVLDPLGASTNTTMLRTGSTIYFARPYDDVGTYDYRVSTRDAAWNWAAVGGTFRIRDTTAPLADAGPDRPIEAGTTLTFDGSGSSDNVGITSYVWSLFDGVPFTYTGVTATHTFNNVATIVVTLTVRDAAGNTATDSFTVFVVDPRPPDITDVRADPPVQDVGGIVTISARVFDQFGVAGVWVRVVDPQGSPINVSMTPAGGRYESALPYRVKGIHLFEIWASDRNSNWAAARGAFEIADLSPPSVAASAAPSSQDIFAPVAITATVTDNDGVAGATAEVRDPYGVKTVVPMALSGGVWRGTYSPSVLGIHGVTVWASDLSGNLGQGSAPFLSVDREAPTISANAPSIAEVLSTVDLAASVADNLGSFVATLEVKAPTGASLGNRTLFGPSPFSIAQRVPSLGLFTWTVYAVDPSGNAAKATGAIQVVDSQPPIADAGPDRTVLEGTLVPLDGSGSTDNYGIASYVWTFSANGAPQVLQGARVAFAFHLAGTYTVRLIVTDLSGKTGEDTATITVAPLDTDADGLSDRDEATAGTDPNVRDTDDDGILDGNDLEPLTAAFDVGRLLGSWFGVLLLFITFLLLLGLGFRRRGKEETERAPPPVARVVARSPAPRRPLPPPPTD